MPAQVLCPNCRKPLTVSQEQVGQSLGCPHCRKRFSVNASKAPRPSTGDAREAPSAAAARETESLPANIGRYEIRRKLGEGAFGLVLQGYDASLDRLVAIKVLRPEKLQQKPGARGTAAAVQRFLREGRAVAKLLHGNIVPVFELGEHEGAPFIVSAFIKGRTLATALAEHDNGLEAGRAVHLVLQLLDALAHAHEQKIIHRDVKPDNILVDDSGKLYLMDFGLAGWVEQEESRMTQAGTIMGTPHYMPPEQAGGEVDRMGPASDQYSAAVTLYELLTGNLPFPGGPNLTVLLAQILQAVPTPLREWRPDIDSGLEAVCLKALAKDPAQRYADCQAFAASLRRWLETCAEGPTLRVEPTGERMEGSRRGQRSTLAGAAGKQPTVEADPELIEVPEPSPAGGGMSRRGWLALVAAVLALMLVGAAAFAILSSLGSKPRTQHQEQKGIKQQLNE